MPTPRLKDSLLTKSAAYSRINRKFPKAKTLLCKDCGKQAREYDHYLGFGKNWNKFEPVCRSCHVKREVKRGIHGGYWVSKKYIGPRLEDGRFKSVQGRPCQKVFR